MPVDDKQGADSEGARSVFARRLERLMELASIRDGRRYTVYSLVEDLEVHGYRVARQTLYNLLNSTDPNPTQRILLGLAEVFDVPLDYFGDTARGREIAEKIEEAAKHGQTLGSTVDWQLGEPASEADETDRLEAAMRRPAVRNFALRASEVSDEFLQQLDSMLDFLGERYGDRRQKGDKDA